MVKSHEKKCQKLFLCDYDRYEYSHKKEALCYHMVKICRVQQEKMMDFDYCKEYLKRVYQLKYCYGSV